MTLGERITQLRKQKGLSQDALAQVLNVSRQSISKWETGASTPELEKLIALSDLFQISMDELVRDIPLQATSPTPPCTGALPAAEPPLRTQHTVGLILMAIGISSTVLGLLFLRNVFMLGLILVVYGGICLIAKQHAGLIIGWITMLPILLLHQSFTGIRLFSVMNPIYYQNVAAGNWILAWIIWIILGVLIWRTVRAFTNKKHIT